MREEHFEAHALGRPYHAALVDLAGRSEPHGHHDYVEVMLVLDGDGSQDLGDHVQPLRAGELILIRQQDRHAISGPVRFFNIAFPADRWRAFAELAGVGPAWHESDRPPGLRLDPADEAFARAERCCAVALDRFHRGPRRLDLVRFWTDILPLLEPGLDLPPDRPSGAPGWLVEACAAMHREDNLRQGLPRLLELARVSPAHLTRSVRRHYGSTAAGWVAALRLRHAAVLLSTTTRTVADVASACGFSSPAYFTRCFRAAHGMSPREFRLAARDAFVPRESPVLPESPVPRKIPVPPEPLIPPGRDEPRPAG